MSKMPALGLIINPMAGRDIRRLVAYASLQTTPEKALIGRRILAGIAAVPNVRVLMPDDAAGVYGYLWDEMRSKLPLELVPSDDWAQTDSTGYWVTRLVAAGADALIVVGGDGTQRNVAQVQPPVPVLPVAGGTNNVACYWGDQTTAGFAAARYLACELPRDGAAERQKLLHLTTDTGVEDVAVVDVALVAHAYTGALAVWHPEAVEDLVLAIADPVRPGLSHIGSRLHPLTGSDNYGLRLVLGESPSTKVVDAVLAPGLMGRFSVARWETFAFEQPIRMVAEAGGSLALDGERTWVLKPGSAVSVRLVRDGPYILHPERILQW
jgi:hypothetical protein